MAETSPGRPARRSSGGDGRNRERILDAARREFAAKGFRGATMRSIAAEAGFDVALLAHYFRNKDGLFAATLELPPGTGGLLHSAVAPPEDTQGERLTRGYLSLWEDPATGSQMRALARSALSNDAASERVRVLLTGLTADPDVGSLVGRRTIGFSLAMAHLMGVALVRYISQTPPVATMGFDECVARVAPAVQRHLGTPDR